MKNKIFKIVAFGVLFVSTSLTTCWSQHIFEFGEIDLTCLSETAQSQLHFYQSKSNVIRVDLAVRNETAIEMGTNQFSLNEITTLPLSIFELEEHDSGVASYFGQLPDETGITLTEKNGMVVAKFRDGDTRVTVLPLECGIHMFIRYGFDDEPLTCGYAEEAYKEESETRGNRNDDGCNIRVLIAFSDDAVANIPGDLHLFAQSVIDESNLAFTRSDVNMRFEIATVRVFNMTENPTVLASCRSADLQRFFDNDPPFGNVDIYRGNFRSDLQVLIVNQNIGPSCSGGNLFGQVVSVGVDDDDAYAICTLPGITDNRFTFTHELGHIMGARHENHGSSYNRGYVFGTSATNRLRTLMARTAAAQCNLDNSCRIQNFSNPGINFAGIPTGVAGDFDNARWLDENADDVQNYRQNANNLTINPETTGNNVMANYTADNSITTSGAVVVNSGGELNLRAGSAVNLNNGFTLNNGSTFGIVLGNCTRDQNRSAVEDDPAFALENFVDIKEQDGSEIAIYPNPVFDGAEVQYQLPEAGSYRLDLSDGHGNYLLTISEQVKAEAGQYSQRLSNAVLDPGIYYITLTLSDRSLSQKFIVVK